ncbi:hypothetical protein BHE97_01835 [Aeromicrobium sp. PE09-221]|uniref:acetoacetate decarboxylase family protein n=1 Tax=Aeromicrobium sp. PE09-221 TaxID=1898043 RepID=UPI000B3E6D55|nr:acetoacetate decarboxylase family protein [Aeromicrobium sp. PE09-221]OUZ12472.1 hypothetical protein BHE97_01835 [Aeromicrobium sp. PE09-221]
MTYDPLSYFEYLGYPSGDQPYHAPGLRSLSVFCRGERENLTELLRPTPFELDGDVFAVQIADFRTADIGAYWDSGIVVPVRYGEHRGVTYLFEWEDQPWSIAFGREVWGYPKRHAAIGLEDNGPNVHGELTREGEKIFSISATLEDGYDDSAWAGRPLYPHLQVHALPAVEFRGFSTFEIVRRDTSKDYRPISRQVGPASVELGAEIALGDTPLIVDSVLGGEYTVGDYACTRENGVARVIDRLVP